jgi:hypothetical protein
MSQVTLTSTNRQASWGTQEKQQSLIVEEVVDLALSPYANAAQVMRFTSQVEQTLHPSILQTVGSWKRGSVVTIQLKSTPLANLLALLRNIPNVADAQVESPRRERLPSFVLRKLNLLPSSKNNHNNHKSILITLV